MFWPGALRSQGTRAERVMPFGQSNALRIRQQASVEERRRRKSQGLIKQQLPGGAEQEVGSADNLGDLHGRVVHHASQLVGGDTIVAANDEVAEVLAGDKRLLAEIAVGKGNPIPIRNTKAPTD